VEREWWMVDEWMSECIVNSFVLCFDLRFGVDCIINSTFSRILMPDPVVFESMLPDVCTHIVTNIT
jgi:hypothetical protein